ncbi:MAG: FeoA family protein [Bacillota bacterium]
MAIGVDGLSSALADLAPGRCGLVTSLLATGLPRRRLLDLGFVPGTRVESVRRSPAGDPTAFALRGATIALRHEEADLITIRVL